MPEFASRGVGGTALGLSIGALGAQLLGGGIGNILGGALGNGAAVCNENMPVNRYELGLQQENAALKTQVEMHKAEIYTDNKLEALNDRYEHRFRNVESQIAQQAVHNATSDGLITCMAAQIAQLQGLTRMVIPNSSICPGYGNVTVTPATPATTTTT